jgi:hypothetical protein
VLLKIKCFNLKMDVSLLHGNDITDLKIQIIREILSNLEKNMKLEKKLEKWVLSFDDKKYFIDIDIAMYIDKNDICNLQILYVHSGKVSNGGLCTVLCIYMLRKLYNLSFNLFPTYTKNKMLGNVFVSSYTVGRATACYKKSFKNIDFEYDNEYHAESGFHMYFKKEKPKDGWKKINEPYVYNYKRLKINYFIGKDKIWVEKIKNW